MMSSWIVQEYYWQTRGHGRLWMTIPTAIGFALGWMLA